MTGPAKARQRLAWGSLPNMILVAFDEGATTAAEVQRWVEDRTKGGYRPGAGAIYPRVHSLENRGLVIRGGEVRIRPRYTLSAEGKRLAKQARAGVEEELKRLRT